VKLSCIEFCSGAGGQALGLERAGFRHECLVELDPDARATTKFNRPAWNHAEGEQVDLRHFDATKFRGVDLVAGGLPCPPFSIAGQQLGAHDDRDLFPEGIRVLKETRANAFLFENVKGLMSRKFDAYREELIRTFTSLGYRVYATLVNALDFGVCQSRQRLLIVGIRNGFDVKFRWPVPQLQNSLTVGQTLLDLMAEHGWHGAAKWARTANGPAPTIVGGSKKHGGADLGPSGARKAWLGLGVDGREVANAPPQSCFEGIPRLTLQMVARLQSFPDDWQFCGGKTSIYRQIGNAPPAPISHAVGQSIANVLRGSTRLEKAA